LTQFEPLLEKAERYIHSAELLAKDGDLDSAASRLYYAMFYIAQALLEERGYTYSSHRALISAYGQYFAKQRNWTRASTGLYCQHSARGSLAIMQFVLGLGVKTSTFYCLMPGIFWPRHKIG